MARRTATVAIAEAGRDAGKTFFLTELPAQQAEEWFTRAIMLLVRSGTDVPPNIFSYGPMAFAAMGLGAALTGLGKAPWPEVKTLFDEMFGCVAFKAPNGSLITDRAMVDSQIEEVTTRFRLREEVLSLHLGFSLAARLSAYRDLAARLMMSPSPTTPTPAPTSVPSSASD